MMELVDIYSVTASNDDALFIDLEYLDSHGVQYRENHTYRVSDPYGPLTPLITQWLADNIYEILPYVPPLPVPDPVIVIPAVTFWERMSEAEGEQVEAAMLSQSFRTRQIFTTAQTYRSDHALWPLLEQVATELFGNERATKLLERP